MSIASRIREQLLSSFRAELAEHVQTMTDGLLALERGLPPGAERREVIETVFRAAHSLKGAARAVGVTAIEQLAHALESVLAGMRARVEPVETIPSLFSACYAALDAIQAVQQAYEAGQTTPPAFVLEALNRLEPFRLTDPSREASPAAPAGPAALEQPLLERRTPERAASEPHPADSAAPGGETIRVQVAKLDALLDGVSELLLAGLRAGERLEQVRQGRELNEGWQKDWAAGRGAYHRLVHLQETGWLSLHRLRPVEATEPEPWERVTPALVRWAGSRPAAVPISGSGLPASPPIPGDSLDLRELSRDIDRVLQFAAASQARFTALHNLFNELLRHLAGDAAHLGLVIDDMEEEIKHLRMLPFSTITTSFGRMVRDLARQAGKEAFLRIEGSNTELDKRVLEQIKDPIMHLLRNAVDHGIEPPEVRHTLGKPRVGTITLVAEPVGKEVVIRVSDDGAGLDVSAIRQAVERQSAAGEVEALSDAEVAALLFDLGITTSPRVTSISGRGVGLHVVRRNLEELHGWVEVSWQPGAGTTFTLTLPPALAGVRGLFVRVAGQLFALPTTATLHLLHLAPEEIFTLEGSPALRFEGRPLALVWMQAVLDLEAAAPQTGRSFYPVVVLATTERRMAFVVDELVGEEDMIVKALGHPLRHVTGLSGATVLGSGEIVPVLNPAELIRLASHTGRAATSAAAAAFPAAGAFAAAAGATAKTAARTILVVDDSITTRTLEKNILEAAGYQVRLATDGQEALDLLAGGDLPNLVVADIVMPHLDGIELTRRLKADQATAHLPVILVTSLDSPQDKERGIEVGADAYIVKSRFDQNNLLNTIEQLI